MLGRPAKVLSIFVFFFLVSRMKDMVLNIDLAPTFLDIAGVNIPKDMDGSSIMKLFRKTKDGRQFKRYRKRLYITFHLNGSTLGLCPQDRKHF